MTNIEEKVYENLERVKRIKYQIDDMEMAIGDNKEENEFVEARNAVESLINIYEDMIDKLMYMEIKAFTD